MLCDDHNLVSSECTVWRIEVSAIYPHDNTLLPIHVTQNSLAIGFHFSFAYFDIKR